VREAAGRDGHKRAGRGRSLGGAVQRPAGEGLCRGERMEGLAAGTTGTNATVSSRHGIGPGQFD
jgi:hypothetical protein